MAAVCPPDGPRPRAPARRAPEAREGGPRRSRRRRSRESAPNVAGRSTSLRLLLLSRHSAHGAVERREIAQAGEREGQEKAMVGRLAREVVEIERLVLERQPAALRVLEARHLLLEQRRVLDVVIERVETPEPVVRRVRVRGQRQVVIEERLVVETRQAGDEGLLA